MNILQNDETLRRFIAAFEAGTYPKEEWTHEAHVIMAGWYWTEDATTAPERIKKQLLHYIACQGIVTTKERGYHETLTQLWIRLSGAAIQETTGPRLQRIRAVASRYGTDSKLHQRYYSYDVLRDPVARSQWVPPDIGTISELPRP